MKTIKTTLTWTTLLIGLVVLSVTFTGCKKKNEEPKPNKTDQVKSMLTGGKWTMQSVTVDGVDKTDVYAGLTVTFTSSGYTSTNGAPVWPASGTWFFQDDTGVLIGRGDGTSIVIENITQTNLKLDLSWPTNTLGSGRVSSVAGNHVFTFSR